MNHTWAGAFIEVADAAPMYRMIETHIWAITLVAPRDPRLGDVASKARHI